MRFYNRMYLLIFIFLVISPFSGAQNTFQDYLETHNGIRARVGVGYMRWNRTLKRYAENYASSRNGDCNLVHSHGPYGENLATGSSVGAKRGFLGTDGVFMWWKEKEYYDYRSNSCATGRICSNYTQVVWRGSTDLGCARTACNTGGWFVICNYYPPGNIIGQRPY